jgi:phosphoglycerate dehydrogenase-like enzyme
VAVDRPLVAVIDAVARELPDMGAVEDIAQVVELGSVEGLEPHLGDLDVVFAWNFDRPRLLDLLPRTPRLRWVQSISAGVEDLVSPALREHGVVLTNAAGVYDPGLAESVLGFLLAFSARILESARRAPGEWVSDPVRLLRGTLALVVGAGSIGTETGRLLRSAGLRVRGVARTARPADDVFESIAGPDSLQEELAAADHVVNVLPITPATRRKFDAAAFAAMKPTALFVNIGRGATVDEQALIAALEQGRIGGAALDVFEVEPLPVESPLWRMSNVLVSPHRAGDHERWADDVVAVFVDNLRRFVAGAPLRNVVDVELGYAPGDRSSSAGSEPITQEPRASFPPRG